MIEYRKGDIFESDAEALVNPINCEGKMGKGLAYQFKKRFPLNNKEYEKKCFEKKITIGGDLFYLKENSKIIINFPTKDGWRENSKIQYIQVGLEKLYEVLISEKIQSIAIPPIGAGNGKLDWGLVKNEIEKFSLKLHDKNIKIIVYQPTEVEMNFQKIHLLLVKILKKLKESELKKEEISEINFQKIIYLYDLYYNKGYFKFQKDKKGPFSKLINVIYNDIRKFCKSSEINLNDLEKALEKKLISDSIIKDDKNIQTTINKMLLLKKEYEIENVLELENKLELMTTILFLIEEKNQTRDLIKENVLGWNKRKKEKFNEQEIFKMCLFLENKNYVQVNLFGEYSIKK